MRPFIDTLALRFAVLSIAATAFLGCSPQGNKAGLQKKADAYYAAGDFDKAEIEYKNIIQQSGLDPHAVGRLGLIYIDQGRAARGSGYLQKALELQPDNLEVRGKLAYLYAASNNASDARDAATYILERRPQDAEAPILLAEVANQPREILATRARLSGLPPTASILTALALLDLKERKLAEAESTLTKALELDPKSVVALSTMGRIYWLQNDLERADKMFAAAVAVAPPRSAVRLQYAGFLNQIGKVEQAKKLLDDLIAKTPDFLPTYMMRAGIAAAEKKTEESIALLDRILDRDPEHPDAMRVSAEQRIGIGETDKAIATLERGVATFPGAAPLHFQLGKAYVAKGDLGSANASFTQAVKLDPSSGTAVLALATVNLRQRDFATVVNTIRPFLQQNPTSNEAKMLLADAYRNQGKLEDALALYQQLLGSAPKNAQIHYLAGSTLLQMQKRAEARKAFTTAVDLNPNFLSALEQLVSLDITDKQGAAAKSRVESYLTRNPKEGAGHFMLGRLHLALGEMEPAERALRQAIELSPSDIAPQVLLSRLYIQTNQTSKAIENLTSAVNRNPNDAASLMMLAVLQEQQKNFASAKDSYEKVLALNPRSGEALNNLANIHAEHLNDLDKALDFAQRARDLLPASPVTADTLGWVLFKRQQYVRALALLSENETKLSDNADARFHLGSAHYMMGNEASARSEFEKALALDAKFAGADIARQSLAILNLDVTKAPETVRPMLEAAVARRPDDAVALSRLAALHEKSGRSDLAMEAYSTLLKSNPGNVNVALSLIRLHRGNKEFGKALELAKATRQLAPNDGKLGHVLGRLSFENGDHRAAVGVLQEAARRLEDDPEVRFDLAEAAYSIGQASVAERSAEEALKLGSGFTRVNEARDFLELIQAVQDPTRTAAAQATADRIVKANPNHIPALMVKGLLAERSGGTSQAQELYESLNTRYPEFAPAKRQLAILYSRSPASSKRGLDVATKAREAFPTDAELAKAFGVILYHQGTFPRAINLLAESARTRSDDPEVYFYLGMSQYQSKDTTSANRSLQRALELGLPAALATEARKALAEKK